MYCSQLITCITHLYLPISHHLPFFPAIICERKKKKKTKSNIRKGEERKKRNYQQHSSTPLLIPSKMQHPFCPLHLSSSQAHYRIPFLFVCHQSIACSHPSPNTMPTQHNPTFSNPDSLAMPKAHFPLPTSCKHGNRKVRR